jgi:mono/diheme cytochrome c family protein
MPRWAMVLKKPLLIALLAAGGLILAIVFSTANSTETAQVEVVMPALTTNALEGQDLFAANCASCHGANGSGSGKGPPLIHIIYEPSHHGDAAFVMAMRQGVRAHHWQFGDMAPIEGLSVEDMQAIITFVREVQVANGID